MGDSDALLHLTMPPKATVVGDTVAMLIDALAPSRRGLRAQQGEAAPPHDELRLAVTEAINNVILHSGHPVTHPIHLTAGRDGLSAWVEIEDLGRPLPEALLSPDRFADRMTLGSEDSAEPEDTDALSLDTLPEGGWGWMLIHASVDGVRYHRRRSYNLLRLEKSFAP
ncbi:MAG: ATP-binding protein [Pseudomonadota bacterium]